MEQSNFEIPRNSPTIKALIGKKILELTWYNASVYRFAEPYSHIDHLHYVDREENQRYNIFGNPELMNILQREEYPLMTQKEPSNSDIESYMKYEMSQLEKRIND